MRANDRPASGVSWLGFFDGPDDPSFEVPPPPPCLQRGVRAAPTEGR